MTQGTAEVPQHVEKPACTVVIHDRVQLHETRRMDVGEIQRCACLPSHSYVMASAIREKLIEVPTVIGQSAAAITVENDLMEPL